MSDDGQVEMSDRKLRKQKYWQKLEKALNEYKNILVVGVDFVGSKQMQQVRLAIRGKAKIIMGKNTLMRKVIREMSASNPKLEGLLPFVRGNIGFVFCDDNEDMNELRKVICTFVVPAAAKTGVLAPCDVKIPAGPTGLDPGQTQFFQALNIATKISKGAIEITNEVHLIHSAEKVSASAVALLNKLNIKPFTYGIDVSTVYEDGSIYDAKVLDLSEDDLLNKFFGAVGKLAAISFQIGQVNAATVPHSFGRAFKILCAICINTEYVFEELKLVKEMLENPDAFGGGDEAAGGDDAPAAAAAVVEEEEEEEAADMGGLFGDDDGGEEADY